MKITWGEGTEKSFGNGIFRVTIKEAIVAVGAISAVIAGIQAYKSTGANNTAAIARVEAKVDKVDEKVGGIADEQQVVKNRVLVLETTVSVIRTGVRSIQNEEIFDPDVTKIKVKRP